MNQGRELFGDGREGRWIRDQGWDAWGHAQTKEQEQAELIGDSGCAHSWTQIYVVENTAPPQSLPDIDRRRVIAYVCLRCGSYRPAIADR